MVVVACVLKFSNGPTDFVFHWGYLYPVCVMAAFDVFPCLITRPCILTFALDWMTSHIDCICLALCRICSADSSGPVSPVGLGEVTVTSGASEFANETSGDAGLTIAEDSDPLLHHSYSGGPAEEPLTVQEAPTEEVSDQQVSAETGRLETSRQSFVTRSPFV